MPTVQNSVLRLRHRIYIHLSYVSFSTAQDEILTLFQLELTREDQFHWIFEYVRPKEE